ncbi:metallophosphoesterase [Pseudohalocynthiibacter sp. F2068]|uniref:metallophosphoesterase n=1 Tax=Pseudohalocynthiibacter sp. F2068 TaxID=2926418 RepID=UPI001FF2B3B3|nr:metallophosphoesterase [Pseudohalocynthiibacter sp. F2068]MCK0101973.1 metallophosphoesterase [Pseudohalocynthiibacter sp. F2068]
MYDVIPDIHGQSAKLKGALASLGYKLRNGAWRHDNPGRQCIFLGDFIDRGLDNREVLSIVRNMVDAGTAFAIMGNHELNAIHFHTDNPKTGEALRPKSEKNIRQHKAFLEEFPIGETQTADAIAWMRSLPLYLELDGFRAVHACWDETKIERLRGLSNLGVLSEDQIIRAADERDPLFNLVETTTKGPEAPLPPGYSIKDKEGSHRTEIRLQWWNSSAKTWPDIAISVPDLRDLPQEELPSSISGSVYPEIAIPVFFGHYWLDGTPAFQAPNALCLDYSAGTVGPLVTYHMDGQPGPLSLEKITVHEN